ncbi:MAG TPA: DUF4345 domain-containing protein [Sphingomicrobium sp.]|nr:DUF4345 domain-containing protein [Sphingomicrobium sp.]
MTERRLFQAIVLFASIVPVAAGAAGVLIGPTMLHGVAVAGPDLESHFRYLSGLLLGIGLCFAACVADLDRRAGLHRALSFIVILGGLGRILNAVERGAPTGANRLAFLMELIVVPSLLLWLGRIEKRAKHEWTNSSRSAGAAFGDDP